MYFKDWQKIKKLYLVKRYTYVKNFKTQKWYADV